MAVFNSFMLRVAELNLIIRLRVTEFKSHDRAMM